MITKVGKDEKLSTGATLIMVDERTSQNEIVVTQRYRDGFLLWRFAGNRG
jgi:hypothetical protein